VPTPIEQNLSLVEDRLDRALRRAGRRREEITLLAVTKVFPASVIEEAYSLGLREFGENYVQEFETKHPVVSHLSGARFHLIGHLQSNKARRAAELFHVIQTVDTPKLARRLDEAAREGAATIDVMVEVKLSEESSKAGTDPSALPPLIDAIQSCPNLRLTGLMTMPPWSDDPEQARPYFRRLRQIGEQHGIARLSMGMSHDFEAAIEEGSTCIRVGTALFGRRRKPGT